MKNHRREGGVHLCEVSGERIKARGVRKKVPSARKVTRTGRKTPRTRGEVSWARGKVLRREKGVLNPGKRLMRASGAGEKDLDATWKLSNATKAPNAKRLHSAKMRGFQGEEGSRRRRKDSQRGEGGFQRQENGSRRSGDGSLRK